MLEIRGLMNLHKEAKNDRKNFKYYTEIKGAQKTLRPLM